MKTVYRWPLCLVYAVVFACGRLHGDGEPSTDLRKIVNDCIELHVVHGNPLFESEEEHPLVDEFDEVSYIAFRELGSYRVEFGNYVTVPDGNYMGCSVTLATNRIFGLDYYIDGKEGMIRLFEPDRSDGIPDKLPEPGSESGPDINTYSIDDFHLNHVHQ